MEVRIAEKLGFCFGVKRAIKIAEQTPNSTTLGPLIHNPKEIARLQKDFNVNTAQNIDELDDDQTVIVRTHGIEKEHMRNLKKKFKMIDATCPFVTKPQNIVEEMSNKKYQIVIFGDKNHPEVKGIVSYAKKAPIVVLSITELEKEKLEKKVVLISQTTKKNTDFLKIANYLISNCREARIFNTICNATFENQDATEKLSKEVDIMIIIGGKNSSNTKQLQLVSSKHCKDSYLIEDEFNIDLEWFKNKKVCGITAGASTPDWIINQVISIVRKI